MNSIHSQCLQPCPILVNLTSLVQTTKVPSCYLKVVIGPQGSFFKNVCAAQSRVFCVSRTSFWRRFEPHIETTNNTQEWVCLFGCILTRASTEFYRSVLCFFSFLRSTSLTQRGGWTWAFSSSSLRSKFPNCYHWLYWFKICVFVSSPKGFS